MARSAPCALLRALRFLAARTHDGTIITSTVLVDLATPTKEGSTGAVGPLTGTVESFTSRVEPSTTDAGRSTRGVDPATATADRRKARGIGARRFSRRGIPVVKHARCATEHDQAEPVRIHNSW
jgi:hypothetical protein